MTAFLGTAGSCIFLAVSSLLKWEQINTTYSLLGCGLYLVGTVGVTMVFNVPLNDALARVDPSSIEGMKLWATYLSNWTFWNHTRTVAALAAAIALALA
jgi:uncharacterized membrane protein